MLTLRNIAYTHPNGDLLFENVDLTINGHKIALIGNNGIGKSTLLRILAGELKPSGGIINADSTPYYVPQHFGQFNDYTVAQALQVEGKLHALKGILGGAVSSENLALLNDDWTIEERCNEALLHWGLDDLDLEQKMSTLSGGQKTRVFLSGILIHNPQIVLLDEPSNHLDVTSRAILYNYILTTKHAVVVVSHDRTLLNLLSIVCELTKRGVISYGGNYDFYAEQKAIQVNAMLDDLKSKEKSLQKAKETERETLERQQKLDARGKKKQEKAGLPTIAMNTLRNSAEKSTSRIKDIHAEKINSIYNELYQLRKELPGKDKIKMGFDDSALHKGKILVTVRNVNYGYNSQLLWKSPLNFEITSGQRVVIKGVNGSGKTTLIKLLLSQLHPTTGEIRSAGLQALYIDQDYSLVDDQLNVHEQAQKYNNSGLEQHEVKSRLTHFLFTKADWEKSCKTLSGGEKMRLILCCLTIGSKAPDMIVLDEPTNNLDIQNTEILTTAINEYRGTLVVISHDTYFLQRLDIKDVIELNLV